MAGGFITGSFIVRVNWKSTLFIYLDIFRYFYRQAKTTQFWLENFSHRIKWECTQITARTPYSPHFILCTAECLKTANASPIQYVMENRLRFLFSILVACIDLLKRIQYAQYTSQAKPSQTQQTPLSLSRLPLRPPFLAHDNWLSL